MTMQAADVSDFDEIENLTRQPEMPGQSLDQFEHIMRIPVTVDVVLGSVSMPVSSLLKLGPGAVVALDHRVGEPVDVMVNGRLVAKGEVVIVDEQSSRFGVSLTEIVSGGGMVQQG
jgi:flagellar motor switch protein FliN/FliY